jgi:hypothetical protein
VGLVPRREFRIALKQELQSAGNHLVARGAAEPAISPQSLLDEAVTPAGSPDALKVTFPVKLPRGIMMTRLVALRPGAPKRSMKKLRV